MAGLKAGFDADFGKFLTELDKVQVKLKGFAPETERTSAQLQRMADSLQGHKLAQQAGLAVAAVEKIGGVARLSDRELVRFGSTVDAAVQKLQRMGSDVPPALRIAQIEIDNLRKPIEGIGEASTATTSKVSGFLSSLATGAGLGVGLGLIERLGDGLRQMAQLGAQLAPLQTAFVNLSGSATVADQKLTAMREATLGLAGDIDLMQAANKGALLGLDAMGIDMAELAGVATRLGRAMGQDTAKSVDDLTTALARQSPMILDNLGIKLNLTEATEAYARSLGKSADALTDDEKKLAFATAAMEAARAKAAQLGDVTLTVSDQFGRIGTSLENVIAHLGAAGNESGILARALGIVADRLDETVTLVGDVTDRFGEAFPIIGQVAQAFRESESAGKAFGQAMQLTVAPALSAVVITLKSIKDNLDTVRALRQWMSGELSDVNIAPTRGRDIQLSGGTFGQGQRAKDWLAAEQQRLQDEYIKRQDEALKKLEQGGTRAATSMKKMGDALKTAVGPSATQDVDRLTAAIGRLQVGVNAHLTQRGTGQDNIGGALYGGDRTIFGAAPIGYTTLQQSVSGMQRVSQQTQTVAKATRDWAAGLSEVSRSFSQLAQISGGLDRATQQIGKFFSALDAAQGMTRSLGLTGKAGANTASGLAGGFLGFDLGSNFGRAGGTLAGAAGGALAGAPYAAATGGASVAIGAVVGGVAGYFGSRQAESELRKLKDLQAEALVAQHGGLDALLTTAGRLGLEQGTFLKRFYGEPREFAKAVNELNIALAEEQRQADKLGVAIERVTKAQGILNREQLAALGGARSGSPIEDQARAFLTGQSEQAIRGLERFITAGPLTAGGASGAGEALGQSFEALVALGVPADEAIRRLTTSIEGFRVNAIAAGAGSTEAFDLLDLKLKALTDSTMGAFLERAFGAGQALAGLANQGRVNQAIFSGLAPSITDAFRSMENLGQGGVEAVRLLQGPLQNVWQLQRDFGFEVDASTQSLLDFAESSGLIGEKFRPAQERMADGIEKLVELIGGIGSAFLGLPSAAGRAADGIAGAFNRLEVPSLGGISPGQFSRGQAAAQGATAGGGVADVYIDGQLAGYAMARHQGAVAEYVTG